MTGEEPDSGIDLDSEEVNTYLGDDTFGVEDDWNRWDTNAWSRDTQDVGEVRGSGCDAPDTGTWIWGAIDGECQWIETTECP